MVLTEEEEEKLELYNVEKEIQKEINKIFWEKNKISLLSFDIKEKELHIAIDYNDLLNKKLAGLVTYYKEKNNLDNIIFYI